MEDLLENVLWHRKEDRYINYRQRQNAEIGEIVFQDKKGERVSGKVGFQIFKLVGAVMIDFRTDRLSHWSTFALVDAMQKNWTSCIHRLTCSSAYVEPMCTRLG